jgi:hypothetical protein
MKFSKFFAAAVIACSSTFAGTAAFAGEKDGSGPPPMTPPATCDCATSTSVIDRKNDKGVSTLVTSMASGRYGAATVAALDNDGSAFTGGAASNRTTGKLEVQGEAGGTKVSSIVN